MADENSKLDLGDLDMRAHDLDDKSADEISGGWFKGGNPFGGFGKRPASPKTSKPKSPPSKPGHPVQGSGRVTKPSGSSKKDDPFSAIKSGHKKLMGGIKKGMK